MAKWQFLKSLKKGEPVVTRADDEPFTPIYLKTPGYCLRAGKAVDFEYHKDVMGAPYFCHYCGEITERVDSPLRVHIFDPPPILVEILSTAQTFVPAMKRIYEIGRELDHAELMDLAKTLYESVGGKLDAQRQD